MNADWIINTAIQTLRRVFPDAITHGFLVKDNRVFDPLTNTKKTAAPTKTPVEVIIDSFKTHEINGSTIRGTDLKIHIIADSVQDISYYERIELSSGLTYVIGQLIEVAIGSRSAVFTITARR